MKKKISNLFGLTILTILCTTSLSAKEYMIPTENEAIECSIQTVSKSKLQKIFGDISISLNEDYQVIKVKVTNNAQETIILNRDEYLDGLEDVIGPKEDIISLYDKILEDLNGSRFVCNFGASLTGFSGLNCFLISLLTENNELIIFSAFLALMGLPCVIGSLITKNKIKTIMDQKNKTLRSTCLHSNKTKRTKHYIETTDHYKIPKNHTFYDIILINRKKAGKNFLNTNLPRLYYQSINQTN